MSLGKNTKSWIAMSGYAATFAVMSYWCVAASTFLWRNPTANQSVLIRRITDVLLFRALPEFQVVAVKESTKE